MLNGCYINMCSYIVNHKCSINSVSFTFMYKVDTEYPCNELILLAAIKVFILFPFTLSFHQCVLIIMSSFNYTYADISWHISSRHMKNSLCLPGSIFYSEHIKEQSRNTITEVMLLVPPHYLARCIHFHLTPRT
jgi:hypothetical protein